MWYDVHCRYRIEYSLLFYLVPLQVVRLLLVLVSQTEETHSTSTLLFKITSSKNLFFHHPLTCFPKVFICSDFEFVKKKDVGTPLFTL